MNQPYPTGPTVLLRPVEPGDVMPLYRIACSTLGSTWRTRGASISPGRFEAHLWEDVLCQFTICDRHDESAILGLISAIHPDTRREIASLSVLTTGSLGDGPATVAGEAVQLFCAHLFTRCGLRKLMGESFAVVLPALAELGRLRSLLRPQGCFEAHDRAPDGRLCDRHVFAEFRDDFLGYEQLRTEQ